MNQKGNLLRHIPNMISTVRIGLIVLFAVYFRNHEYIKSLIVYGVAFLSDLLDGFLARRFNWVTSIGKLLDPLADKLMLITVLICFSLEGFIPAWVLFLVASKELLMCVFSAFLFKSGVVVEADIFGKLSTGAWAIAVVLVFLSRFITELHLASTIAIMCAVAISMLALFNYALRYLLQKSNAQ